MTKPTLSEIAAMPFPTSRDAMRKHYDAKWGEHAEESAEARLYTVTVDYSYSVSDYRVYRIEAHSEQEAEAKAEKLFEEDASVEYLAELRDITVDEE